MRNLHTIKSPPAQLPVYLPGCLSVSACLPVCLSVCLPDWLPSFCLPKRLLSVCLTGSSLSACLPACAACLSAQVPSSVSAYLHDESLRNTYDTCSVQPQLRGDVDKFARQWRRLLTKCKRLGSVHTKFSCNKDCQIDATIMYSLALLTGSLVSNLSCLDFLGVSFYKQLLKVVFKCKSELFLVFFSGI